MGSIPNPICNPTQGKSSIISLSQVISATLSIHSRPNNCNQYFIEGFRMESDNQTENLQITNSRPSVKNRQVASIINVTHISN